MTAEEILKRLAEGNLRFVKNGLESNNQDSTRRNELIGGQNPYAIILSCADSRVVPELIFDTGLGEIFVVRVAGNIANKSSIASIEYAVAHCGTQLILVLAHQNCGAVTAAVKGGDNGENLNHLLAHIKPAIESSENGSPIDVVAKNNALETVKQLIGKSEIIGLAVNNKKVAVVPAFYNLDSGKVDFL